MGVPALFRWLSKKYPKIVEPVVEDEPTTIPDADGNPIPVPLDISLPNPNGFEVDNLYLDMNGIVHPCTHPEGKPAPETEEDMMVEIFSYTERVVNMTRPRKLLFMAIDGVAPRAKMNQQRSRRFRSIQEAKEKEAEREAGIAMFEAMGHTVSDETKNKKSWDSNAITPGTPFMNLLALSLKYWVVQKMNSDPAWKTLKVIISDASVPGEGEHKIMDYIRRQRVNPGHDPNTQHVIYGLDADLIMLSLATHEPHFKVLREDVFAQDKKSTCHTCGKEGHYAAQCVAKVNTLEPIPAPKIETSLKPPEKKPFIWLDVATLREYLEIELSQTYTPFGFNLEQAIDDWVFLIFFVGNDFLPHLPSLEIREGAIDTLLKIWKTELPRMGGYLTHHGHVVMDRAAIILEGLARSEDDIFRRRRESEQRQDQNAKRQRIDRTETAPSGREPLPPPRSSPLAPPNAYNSSPSTTAPRRPPVDPFLPGGPARPAAAEGMSALGGTNSDVVRNRAAIRMANLSAAESIKAELASMIPLGRKPAPRIQTEQSSSESQPSVAPVEKMESSSDEPEPVSRDNTTTTALDSSAPDGTVSSQPITAVSEAIDPLPEDAPQPSREDIQPSEPTSSDTVTESNDVDMVSRRAEESPRGIKRKATELEESSSLDVEAEPTFPPSDDEDTEATEAPSKARKVNPDGTVEQEDTVKLWEPGYRDRYYQQKFGADPNDVEFRKKVSMAYLEGLAWVLHYYYQGTPSWQWFYPYHFAPFAADFTDVSQAKIKFVLGAPFKPFEQLMGVFPAASRVHIPAPFQGLMVDGDSPILDFYPETFEIDMNGKKMAWQGVALLPFIDQDRLLSAMAPRYPLLSEDERQRNRWGNNLILTADANPLYDFFCGLYTKKRSTMPVALDVSRSQGMSGGVMADPTCVPGSTYTSPFVGKGLHDIHDDRSISALYFYPKQLKPHESILLKDVVRGPPRLTAEDQENTRRRSRGRGGFNNSDHRHGGSYGIGGYDSRPMQYGAPSHRSYNGYGGSGYSRGAYSSHGGSGRGGGYTPSNGGYGGRGGESGQGYHGGRGGGGYSHSSRGGPPRGRW